MEKRKPSCSHQDSNPGSFSCKESLHPLRYSGSITSLGTTCYYIHCVVRPLTLAGYKRGLNKHKIILKHELQTIALCCRSSRAYFGTKFVRPGSNFITHSVVNTTNVRTQQGTHHLLAHTWKTNSYVSLSARLYNTQNGWYNFAEM